MYNKKQSTIMQPQYLSFSKPGTKLPSSTEFSWLQAITEKNFLVVMTDLVNGQIDNPGHNGKLPNKS